MKNKKLMAASFVCSAFFLAVIPAFVTADEAAEKASQIFNWSLLWSGSCEESVSNPLRFTLHNRTELKVQYLPLSLQFRGQVLDRRTLNFELDSPFGNPEKELSHFTGALYHRQTGSRLLFGVLDEWGLPARIRNPWIRSPPYAENHKPIMADLKTAASSTKEDELYLYLSSPVMQLLPGFRLRSFISIQTPIENITNMRDLPAFSAGLDFIFANKTNLLLETFYTGKILPPSKVNTWFSDPPPLPEREFHLYAAAFLYSSPAFSVSSDFALSETFAWGNDIYCNLGITVTPRLAAGRRERPLAISLAADGAGGRFVNRDGANASEGFRGSAKIEWKGSYNSLIRVNTILRSGAFGKDFNRSSTGFYLRFPAQTRLASTGSKNDISVRLTRISLSADRNAVNPLNVTDSYSGSIGFSINFDNSRKNNWSSPLRVVLSGSIKGISENNAFIYPIPFIDSSWNRETITANCDFFWSPHNFQFRSGIGKTFLILKDDLWDFSLSAAYRFKQGRLTLKAASHDFPQKWNWTVSWRIEKI